MKKIVFGITSLGSGGAERVLVDITNKLCDKYDITIFTLYNNGLFESELNKKIKLISVYDCTYNDLSFIQKKLLSFKLVNKHTRKKIYDKYIANKFDIEIAFLEGPMTWILGEKSNNLKIAWIHNDIKDVFKKNFLSNYKQKMNKDCYKNYQELVFVSEDNLNKFTNIFKDIKVNKRVIYNYLDTEAVLKKATEFEAKEISEDKFSIVQVSRLVDQKAVLRLIDVHKKLIDNGYDYNLYIVGDGPLRNKCEEKIKNYHIEDTFHLLGQQKNPYPYIKKANAFLLASYYEGYPMVLLEARALNKYIMITDSAARETLKNYDDSLIVDNTEEGIYDGIKTILDKKIKNTKKIDNNNELILKEIIQLLEGE